MGRIRTKTVKRAARELIEKYYVKLTDDFHINKKILEQVSDVQTKRLRNKIAGFTTHLMKRIQKGPVRGISLKLQEEQREKLFDIAPKESNIDITKEYQATDQVLKMIKDAGLNKLIESEHLIKKNGIFQYNN